MKASTLLRKAKRVIETKGWTQNKYHTKGDGYCVAGAIVQAEHPKSFKEKSYFANDRTDGPFKYLRLAIRVRRNYPVSQWNDRHSRTKKQVLAAFDRAIALAKEVGD